MKPRYFLGALCGLLLAGLRGSLNAEPLLLDQPTNVAEKGRWEAGILNASFEQDEWTYFGAATVEYTLTRTIVPLSVRYGVLDRLEARVLVPYVGWKQAQTGAADRSESGLGDTGIGVKYNFYKGDGESLGVLLSGTAPTGDEEKGLGQGANAGLSLLYAVGMGPLIGYANAGYLMTGEYDLKSGTTEVKLNPGDRAQYGIGLEWPDLRWKGFSLIGEARGYAFGRTGVAGTEADGSAGSTLDLTIGGRCNVGRLKTLLGASFAVGDETDREHDYQIHLGTGWVF